jgi:hypothetical protein
MGDAGDDSRRTSERVSAAGLTAKLVLGTDKTVIECVVSIRDFSKGGASLFAGFKAASGTAVKFLLEGITPNWIDGAVAWCSPVQPGDASVPGGTTHQIGISFKPKDKTAQASLTAAFEHFSKLADEADALDDDEL